MVQAKENGNKSFWILVLVVSLALSVIGAAAVSANERSIATEARQQTIIKRLDRLSVGVEKLDDKLIDIKELIR